MTLFFFFFFASPIARKFNKEEKNFLQDTDTPYCAFYTLCPYLWPICFIVFYISQYLVYFSIVLSLLIKLRLKTRDKTDCLPACALIGRIILRVTEEGKRAEKNKNNNSCGCTYRRPAIGLLPCSRWTTFLPRRRRFPFGKWEESGGERESCISAVFNCVMMMVATVAPPSPLEIVRPAPPSHADGDTCFRLMILMSTWLMVGVKLRTCCPSFSLSLSLSSLLVECIEPLIVIQRENSWKQRQHARWHAASTN